MIADEPGNPDQAPDAERHAPDDEPPKQRAALTLAALAAAIGASGGGFRLCGRALGRRPSLRRLTGGLTRLGRPVFRRDAQIGRRGRYAEGRLPTLARIRFPPAMRHEDVKP